MVLAILVFLTDEKQNGRQNDNFGEKNGNIIS